MANEVYVMEAANIFCGSDAPESSNHLTLSEVKLPNLEENFVDHQAGGAPITIEVDTIIQRMEVTFNLAGWSPQVAKLIGSWQAAQQVYSIYGVIRNRRSGEAIQASATVAGRLGRANPQLWNKGVLQHWEYSIRAITHYELYMDQEEIYFWDFFLNTFSVGGIDRNEVSNRILHIPVSVSG
jgi:uncharacterized protein